VSPADPAPGVKPASSARDRGQAEIASPLEGSDAEIASTALTNASAPAAADGVPAPDSSALVVLVAAVSFALVVSFLCSLFEAVILSLSPGHVEALARRGTRAGKLLKRWKKSSIEVPISAILILNTVAHTVGATVAGSSYEKVFDASTLWIFSLVFTMAVLILTEIIPKTLGVSFARRLASPVAYAVGAIAFLLTWPIWITQRISRILTAGQRRSVTSIEEIRLLAALGSREGDVGPRVAAFIEGVASLRELTVHDVMVPRGGIAYLSGDRSYEDNLRVVRESGHSRFPYTPRGDLDEVDGVVLAKDLLFLEHDSHGNVVPNWDLLKQPLLVVPESKHLDEVLRTFQEERTHLAVVVDEYGGTQGVVTMEDVLEEIVGEIEDETDRVERLIIKRGDGVLVCRGWAETRKVFRVLGIEEKVEAVTVSGFVAELLGRVPVAGDEVEWNHLRLRVLKASKRRAEQVEVTALDRPAAAAGESGEHASMS
jgi:CBS domain containing-hemolysin-like protein